MIGKMTKGSSASGLVNYLLKPKQNAVILGASGVSAVTKQGIINGFDMHIQELGRTDVKHPIGHVALSWSPDDKHRLTDELMLIVAQEYLQEMGIDNVPYVVVQHNCTSHPHVHIAYSRVDYNGKVLKSSKDFRRNAKACKKISDKYGFKMGNKNGAHYSAKLRGADLRRQEMMNKVYKAYTTSYSWQHLKDNLERVGISLSLRMNRQKNGIAGVVFSDGTMSISGSKLGEQFSLKRTDKLFGEKLHKEVLDASAKLHNGFVIAFDTAMQLIAQPTIVQTTGGGGGCSNELETEDEKKRKRLEAEAAQVQHSQPIQEQPAPRRRGRR